MSAPPRPWENSDGRANFNRMPLVNEFVGSQVGSQEVIAAPPPLPPRNRSTSYGSYGSSNGPMNSMYFGSGGMYGSSSYMSPYGGAGLFGGSPYGYNSSFPYRNMFDPRHEGADDSSPFQGIESVVRAISSLSMMMESTYQSMYMSLQAVLGVADNMERLRSVFVDLFGGLAVFRTFVWFAKKILYILGLIKDNPARESAWQAAAAQISGNGSGQPANRGRKAWPILAFFGLMCGGPFILSRFMTPPASSPSEFKIIDASSWDAPGNLKAVIITASAWDPYDPEDTVKCVAKYDFNTNHKGELPFRRGEVLMRQKTARGGWVLAVNRSKQMGLVPADRLKPITQLPASSKPEPRLSARSFPSSTSQQNYNQRPTAQPRGLDDGARYMDKNLKYDDNENDTVSNKGDRIVGNKIEPVRRASNGNVKGPEIDCEK